MKQPASYAAVVIAVGAILAPMAAQIVEKPVPGDPVRIDSGLVAGKVLSSGVKAYFGIPFAAPPVRENRWREPQPVAAWKGVYNADRKMPECIQVLRAHNINHYFGEEATSEDCLYLNLWAPETARPGANLPVVVFIYGGGSTIGSSGMALYGGEGVAKRGAVFVNFNYRLGALGFLAHPELTAESAHHQSGNYAYLDQVAALANDTPYGLAASIWTRDIATAHSLTRKLKSGQVWINAHHVGGPDLPIGGYKQSGWGRELGREGVELYTEIKSVAIALQKPKAWLELKG